MVLNVVAWHPGLVWLLNRPFQLSPARELMARRTFCSGVALSMLTGLNLGVEKGVGGIFYWGVFSPIRSRSRVLARFAVGAYHLKCVFAVGFHDVDEFTKCSVGEHGLRRRCSSG